MITNGIRAKELLHRAHTILLILAVISAAGSSARAVKGKIDFTQLTSPIIFRGDRKYGFRDPAAIYQDGVFYLYFTLSETAAAGGGYYNMTAYSTSSDLVHWTFPEIITPQDRNLNYSSPGNIIRFAGKWVICLQTYPTPNLETFGTKDSRIWIMRSDDLKNRSEPELLRVKGNDVPRQDGGRQIHNVLPRLLEGRLEGSPSPRPREPGNCLEPTSLTGPGPARAYA
jgi:hypothetical protein